MVFSVRAAGGSCDNAAAAAAAAAGQFSATVSDVSLHGLKGCSC